MKKVLFLIFFIAMVGTAHAETAKLQDQNGNAINSGNPLQVTVVGGISAAGGWTDDGTTVRLTTVTDNVGIGTVTPGGFKLDVSGSERISGVTASANGTPAAPSYTFSGDLTSGMGRLSTGSTFLGNNSLAKVVVDSTGNVGIGTSNPSALINGTLAVAIPNGAAKIAVGVTSTANGDTASFRLEDSTGNDAAELVYFTSGTSGTLMGLAKANMSTLFTNFSSVSSLLIGTNGVDAPVAFGVNGAEVGRFNSGGGNFGIGSTAPGTKLDVTGNIRASGTAILTGITSDSGKTDATICEDTTVHQLYAGSGTIGICLGTSTKEAKENVIPIPVGLDKIMKLKAISFNYKPGWGYPPEKVYYGFLAEDVEKVLPLLVGHNEKGETRSADYLGMVPVVIKSIQEIEIQIQEQRRRLDILEKKMK